MFQWPIALSVDIANCVVLLLTGFALVVTLQQLKNERLAAAADAERERHISRMASAQESFREFMHLAFLNADLSTGNYNEGDDIDSYRYDSLIAIMLFSFEEILHVDQAPEWRIAFKHHLNPHRHHLEKLFGNPADPYQCRTMYSKPLVGLIDEFLSSKI